MTIKQIFFGRNTHKVEIHRKYEKTRTIEDLEVKTNTEETNVKKTVKDWKPKRDTIDRQTDIFRPDRDNW